MRSLRRLAPLLAAALAGACTPDPDPTGWRVVLHDLPTGLVSVAGRSATDVWTCGGDPGDGRGPFVLHYDGNAWTRFDTGLTGDLWWVHVLPDGAAFFAGDGGHLARWDGTAFTREDTPSARTIFGVWAASRDDAWAVGGSPDDGTGFVWHRDAAGWKRFPLDGDLEARTTFYKVWGTGPADVWIVGTGGRLLHYDGAAMTDVNTDPKLTTSEKPLFTVHGAGQRVVAVGGYAGGFILERDATGTRNASPTGGLGLSGVFLDHEEHGYAVGQKLSVLERGAGGVWSRVETGLVRSEDLHAVWVDPSGGVWAVGGDILSLPLTHGILIHQGTAVRTVLR